MKSYIGVTGFTTADQIDSSLEAFSADSPRALMAGVLASWKSLRGIPIHPRWAGQFPPRAELGGIFPKDRRLLRLVHYNTETGRESSTLSDLFKIHNLVGTNLDGFQLNISWPSISQLDDYRRVMGYTPTIVLQIGQTAIDQVGGTLEGVVGRLYHYIGVVDGVLFDPSGGKGKAFDPRAALEFLRAISAEGWDMDMGVAGGLGPDSLDLLKPLLGEFPHINTDATGRLLNDQGRLDRSRVKDYLTKSLLLFKLP